MRPDAGHIILGSVLAIAGCLACAYSVELARRSRNWLYLVCAVGSAAFVAGIVGQRVFPSDDLIREIGHDAAQNRAPGPWDAGVQIPLIDLHATPVAIGGLLLTLAGVALVLYFEAVPPEGGRPAPVSPLPLEEDDAV